MTMAPADAASPLGARPPCLSFRGTRRSACTAGIAAVPAGSSRSASAIQAMVEAVPITAQVPAVTASLPSTSDISLADITSAKRAQNRRQSVHAPSRSAPVAPGHHRSGNQHDGRPAADTDP